jgi:regulator of protease activity HflC (stomatin/prohibitin superfamily)
MSDNLASWIVGIVAVFFILCIIPGIGAWAIISAGNVGVITRFGAVNRVATPGLILKVPLVDWVIEMDTRTQKDQVDAQAASQDLQVVKSTIAVNYHLDGTKALDVFQNIGTDYQDKVVSPAIQDTFKATTAKYTAQDLISKREEVRAIAEKELTIKMTPYNIKVDNFNIVNFDFSADYNTAIENKQVSQQNLEKAKIEADTALTQAQGQANAQKALKDSGALSPEYLQYLALTKWNGILPTVTGSGVPFISIPTK